jgi:alginate O-acetyltransferase complex protein AlgI
MRNYLYIPLGGNRVNSKWRLYFNLWFVFLLSGFWHGASWTYIAFGAYHGGFLVAEKFFLGKQLEKLGKLPRILFAFAVVMGGNIIFRSDTIADAWAFFLRLFSFHFPKGIKADKEFFAYLAIAVFFGFFTAVPAGLRIHDKVFKEEYTPRKHALMFSICVVLIIISVGAMSTYGFNPFLYFRF